jgi:hypothetical protein
LTKNILQERVTNFYMWMVLPDHLQTRSLYENLIRTLMTERTKGHLAKHFFKVYPPRHVSVSLTTAAVRFLGEEHYYRVPHYLTAADYRALFAAHGFPEDGAGLIQPPVSYFTSEIFIAFLQHKVPVDMASEKYWHKFFDTREELEAAIAHHERIAGVMESYDAPVEVKRPRKTRRPPANPRPLITYEIAIDHLATQGRLPRWYKIAKKLFVDHPDLLTKAIEVDLGYFSIPGYYTLLTEGQILTMFALDTVGIEDIKRMIGIMDVTDEIIEGLLMKYTRVYPDRTAFIALELRIQELISVELFARYRTVLNPSAVSSMRLIRDLENSGNSIMQYLDADTRGFLICGRKKSARSVM